MMHPEENDNFLTTNEKIRNFRKEKSIRNNHMKTLVLKNELSKIKIKVSQMTLRV